MKKSDLGIHKCPWHILPSRPKFLLSLLAKNTQWTQHSFVVSCRHKDSRNIWDGIFFYSYWTDLEEPCCNNHQQACMASTHGKISNTCKKILYQDQSIIVCDFVSKCKSEDVDIIASVVSMAILQILSSSCKSAVMVDEGEEGGSMAGSEHRPSYKIYFMLKWQCCLPLGETLTSFIIGHQWKLEGLVTHLV